MDDTIDVMEQGMLARFKHSGDSSAASLVAEDATMGATEEITGLELTPTLLALQASQI